jgi:hypothetical protein
MKAQDILKPKSEEKIWQAIKVMDECGQIKAINLIKLELNLNADHKERLLIDLEKNDRERKMLMLKLELLKCSL